LPYEQRQSSDENAVSLCAIADVGDEGLTLMALAPGVSLEQVRAATEPTFALDASISS
jgi:acyl CoA:acetate/3-ketoacid CoA transferase beta subunit